MANDEAVRIARTLFPWLPEEAIRVYAQGWAGTAESPTPAGYEDAFGRTAMRNDPRYETQWFPGNRIEGGGVRHDEADYYRIVTRYETVLSQDAGVNPDLFRGKFGDLIRGEVSGDEFSQRVRAVAAGVLDNVDSVKLWYQRSYGIDMTDEAVIASVLDPDLGEDIVNRRVRVSQIGGMAEANQMNLSLETARRLDEFGVTQPQAQNLFGSARQQISVLEQLARRHHDPDDTFDIEEFLGAEIFADPTQSRRVKRLFASEQAMFSPQSPFAQSGTSLTGLRAR